MRRFWLALAAVSVLAAAGPASGDTVPFYGSVVGTVTPKAIFPSADGTVPTGGDVTFSVSFTVDPPVSIAYLVTSPSSAVGGDGRLTTSTDSSMMSASYSPPYYSGGSPYTASVAAVLQSFPTPASQWPSQEGATRYWQVWVNVLTGGNGTTPGWYVTPVYKVTVATPTPAPASPPAPPASSPPAPTPAAPPVSSPSELTLAWSDAVRLIRGIVQDQTGRSPKGLRRTCSRKSSVQIDCRIDWYDTSNLYAGKLWIGQNLTDADSVYYGFVGLRASRRCVRRHSVKFCARSVSW